LRQGGTIQHSVEGRHDQSGRHRAARQPVQELRVGDAVSLSFDCVVRDADHAPYLRYFNRKRRREGLVPIDEIERGIVAQQQRVLARWPQGQPGAVRAAAS
jgi:hypothetical protein